MPRGKGKQRKSAASKASEAGDNDVLDSFAPPAELVRSSSVKSPPIRSKSKSMKNRKSSTASSNRSTDTVRADGGDADAAGEIATQTSTDELQEVAAAAAGVEDEKTPEYIIAETMTQDPSLLPNKTIHVENSVDDTGSAGAGAGANDAGPAMHSVLPDTYSGQREARYYESQSGSDDNDAGSLPISRPESEAAFSGTGHHIVVHQRGVVQDDDSRATLVFEQTAPASALEKAIVDAVYAAPDDANPQHHDDAQEEQRPEHLKSSFAVVHSPSPAVGSNIVKSAAPSPAAASVHHRDEEVKIDAAVRPHEQETASENEPLLKDKKGASKNTGAVAVDPMVKRRERKFCCF
eukprot:TRINITY_DN3115_c0_g2_i5.p2 TRINITY_DN3115_c0_g2~~TRINITY_DN3115_c0_g2_i5.p2  ORF type:complete len:350 (+),score=122.45 TRINITY_DN3115_c0_g2_i5:1253-2302(+)